MSQNGSFFLRLASSATNWSCADGPPWCSVQTCCAEDAKPSLSQMFGHVAGETLSPNHWWASSCAIVLVERTAE
jgi:hypothetical protein